MALSALQAVDATRRPDIARTSAVGWARALAHETESAHGATVQEQVRSVRAHFARHGAVRATPATVFEPLFVSITYATSLLVSAAHPDIRRSRTPGAIIEWYYAVYGAMRSMLAASGMQPPEQHAVVARAVGAQVRAQLPHPFDMLAKWTQNEEFNVHLPAFPAEAPRKGNANPLTETFTGTRTHARQIILAYLSGTAKYHTWLAKRELLGSKKFRDRGWKDFRSTEARAARGVKLARRPINFLHVAFRYRGKANYRDAVFLAYGPAEVPTAC